MFVAIRLRLALLIIFFLNGITIPNVTIGIFTAVVLNDIHYVIEFKYCGYSYSHKCWCVRVPAECTALLFFQQQWPPWLPAQYI